jgi:hypothetical protein
VAVESTEGGGGSARAASRGGRRSERERGREGANGTASRGNERGTGLIPWLPAPAPWQTAGGAASSSHGGGDTRGKQVREALLGWAGSAQRQVSLQAPSPFSVFLFLFNREREERNHLGHLLTEEKCGAGPQKSMALLGTTTIILEGRGIQMHFSQFN